MISKLLKMSFDPRPAPPCIAFSMELFWTGGGDVPSREQSRGSGFACRPLFVMNLSKFIKVSFFEGSIDLTFDETHFVVSEMVRWGELGGRWLGGSKLVAARSLAGLLLLLATTHKLPPGKSSKKWALTGLKKDQNLKKVLKITRASACHQLQNVSSQYGRKILDWNQI